MQRLGDAREKQGFKVPSARHQSKRVQALIPWRIPLKDAGRHGFKVPTGGSEGMPDQAAAGGGVPAAVTVTGRPSSRDHQHQLVQHHAPKPSHLPTSYHQPPVNPKNPSRSPPAQFFSSEELAMPISCPLVKSSPSNNF